jgi:hypothetical protein
VLPKKKKKNLAAALTGPFLAGCLPMN